MVPRASEKCNGDEGCSDGSDESEETCGADCGGVNFRCDDGQCVKAEHKCDGGSPHCEDGSDESAKNCGEYCKFSLIFTTLSA